MEADTDGVPALPIEIWELVASFLQPPANDSLSLEAVHINWVITYRSWAQTCKMLWTQFGPYYWRTVYRMVYGDVLDIWNLHEIPLIEVRNASPCQFRSSSESETSENEELA